MKKSSLILLFLFVIQVVYSQNEIPGTFFGSTFGSSLRLVRYNLEKEGFKYDEELAEGAIAVSDVPFESFDFNSAVFLFNNNQFYVVNFFINLVDKDETLTTYKSILNTLNKKYGAYQQTEEENAISFHHLNRTIQLQWYVQPFLDGDPRFYISLAYYDETLLPPEE